MTTVNATNFRNDIFSILEQAVLFNEPISISTKNGNAVLLSEDDYRAMLETIYLSSVPQVKEQILEGMSEPLSEAVPEDDVDW